jgi:hypothetical protein
MKVKVFCTIVLFALTTSGFGQESVIWNKWSTLIGEWEGEGNGQTGQGDGIFSFTFDLDEKIIVRKSHSEYPANGDKPKITHDDLMIIYLEMTGTPSRAIYFDNEGHMINYSISYTENSIILLSNNIGDAPIFRLTYIFLDNETIDTKFEMSQDGEQFIMYVEGKSKKVK